MSDFPVYSPTQTLQYLSCTRKWQLERQGWAATFLDWNPAQAAGSAVHAGWAAWNKGGDDAAIEAAVLESLTRDYVESSALGLEALVAIARGGVAGAREALEPALEPQKVAAERLAGEARVLAAEEPMYGCIPDCISEEDGQLVVTQLKTSFKWDDRSQWFEKAWAQRKAEYETSWQLFHEAWAAQENFGRRVSTLRVLHVGLTPRVWTRIHRWGLDGAVLAAWLTHWAKPTWVEIEADRLAYLDGDLPGNPPAPGNPHSCHLYGGCQFKKLCWSFAGDLEKAKGFYAKEEGADGR